MLANVPERLPRREVRTGIARVASAALAGASVLLLTVLLTEGIARAREGVCAAAEPVVARESADAMQAAADALTSPLDRPKARAIYLAILARDPLDEDAAVGLARTDAADGCYALAAHGYREVLVRSPANVEARAGLADVLLWTHRWGEAQATLDEGLKHEPFAPELLSRRARVAYFRGDATSANFWIAEAQYVAPLDPEIQEARDRVYIGQARLGQRVQWFPTRYDDLFTTDATALQRWQRLRFEAGVTVVTRYGATRTTRSGEAKNTIIDGRPSFGTYYHFGNGAWAGGSLGIGAPANALPRWSYGLAAFTPIGATRFSLQGNAALWQYKDDRDVLILSPALGIAVIDTLDVTLRYWLTTVFVPNVGAEHVHSAGVRVGWRPIPRTAFGVDYTYGVQLERNPTAAELLDLRSHILSIFALRLFDRTWGVDGSISIERRAGRNAPDVWGPAIEAGIFARW